MLISHRREKLINTVLFFASRTRHCGKIKLIKLLYLLDFQHYRQTGHSVTGLEYHAWPMGPVPVDFYAEWDDLPADLGEAIEIKPERVVDYVRETVVPKRDFEDRHFTKRELAIMRGLAERFRDDLSKPMVNITHDERGPWSTIWDEGRGRNERIPYSLAVPSDPAAREAVLEAADQFEGILAADRTAR